MTARRVVAWWIDAFAVAAVVVVVHWILGAFGLALVRENLFGNPGTDAFGTFAFCALYLAYRIPVEAKARTSLGKWSLRLEILSPGGYAPAIKRNAWILLMLLSPAEVPFVEPVVTGILAACVFFFGRHPFDAWAKCDVTKRA